MKKFKGFSMIELIVIIGILGLLAALTIPQFQPTYKRAKIKAAKGVMSSIVAALEMWSTENCPSGRITPFYYPPNCGSLSNFYFYYLTPYLANDPRPAFGYKTDQDVNISFQTNTDRSGYTLTIVERTTNTPITAERYPLLSPPVKRILPANVPYP